MQALILEDDPGFQAQLAQALMGKGFNVLCVETLAAPRRSCGSTVFRRYLGMRRSRQTSCRRFSTGRPEYAKASLSP